MRFQSFQYVSGNNSWEKKGHMSYIIVGECFALVTTRYGKYPQCVNGSIACLPFTKCYKTSTLINYSAISRCQSFNCQRAPHVRIQNDAANIEQRENKWCPSCKKRKIFRMKKEGFQIDHKLWPARIVCALPCAANMWHIFVRSAFCFQRAKERLKCERVGLIEVMFCLSWKTTPLL